MAGPEDETRVMPGRMASPVVGPDDASPHEEGRARPIGPWGVMPGPAGGHRLPTETKPFFLTTEFVAAAVALAGLAVTAASSDSLDAGLVWPLATAIVVGFVFSRGFAKAAAPSHSWDPRETVRPSADGSSDGSRARGEARIETDQVASAARYEEKEATRQMSTVREEYGTQTSGPMVGPMYGYGRGYGVRQTFPIETKPFFLTSEFWGSVAAIVGLAIAAGTSEQVDARIFWILATAITVGYVVSRGIAKSGTKSRSWDPREELMQRAGERISRGDAG
jgi:hypothetical protein